MLSEYLKLAFTADGRLPRKQYWTVYGVQLSITILMFVFAFMAAEFGFPYLFVLVVVSVLLNWVASICISVKRLHDCNVSGWWWLLLMWFSWISIIVLGCIKGTEGPNRYGPATTPTLASEVDKARKERIDSTVRRLQETSDDDRH